MADIKDTKENENEVYDPRKKREIIKTILIIFLASLLVLTFCSNTIMNKSLAEISTERAEAGKLVEKIQKSGTVESNQSYDVTVDGNKTIDTIMVKKGQEVKKGDVLFTTGGSTNEKIDAAEKELDAKKLEYQKDLLALPADLTKENQAVTAAREELNAAIAKRDQFVANQGNAQAAQAAYSENNTKLKYYTKLQTKLSGVIAAMEDDSYASAAPEYTADLVRMKNEMTSAEEDYNAVLSQITQIATEGGNTAALTAELEAKSAIYDQKKTEYNNYKISYRGELVAKLEDAENNVDYYTSLVGDPDSGMSSSSSALSGESSSLEMLEQDIKAKQDALETAIATLDSTRKENTNKKAIENLELDAKKKEIEKAEAALEKMKKENESGEITAKYSGVVSNINVKPGEDTVPGSPVATIDLSDEGYTMKITVDAEKCRKVKKGAEAEVLNNWNGDITAVVSEIKNAGAGSKDKNIILNLSGNVESGSELEVSIPCGSGNYDTIVPKSAVHNDDKGDFVLTVSSKSSPLGNRYYAERVDVQKLASDEVSVAVSGALTSGDYVITAASRNVRPNDQVRMKDK